VNIGKANPTAPVTVHFPPHLHQRLQRCAEATTSGSTASLILQAVVEHLARWEAEQNVDTVVDVAELKLAMRAYVEQKEREEKEGKK
jgi:hypothetical protein